jgi:hypothetical protein
MFIRLAEDIECAFLIVDYLQVRKIMLQWDSFKLLSGLAYC